MEASTLNWEFIIDKIQEEKCIFVLGPEVFRTQNGSTLHQEMIESLDIPNNENIYRHYASEDFFLFEGSYHRTLICHHIKRFYRAASTNTTIRKIAQIPVHVFLTVTPDQVLHRAFTELQLSFQSGYYKKNKDPQAILTPNAKNPLIYNVFGCVENEESMVLSHNDLYDYFKSIFARKSMPDKLKHSLKEVHNIIFLGIAFDKWYMQLLLRELGIHKQEFAFTRFAANQLISKEVKTFCFEQFKINFISSEIDEFIHELHHRCGNLGLLRTKGETYVPMKDRIKNFVAKGNLDKAVELLEELAEDSPNKHLAIQLAGRYRKFKTRVSQGILYQEQKDVQESQLVHDLLELATSAED